MISGIIKKYKVLLIITAILTITSVHAAPVPIPEPPIVAAKNYLLIDYYSGRVLAERNMDARTEPASITKMMTAYVVYKEIAAGRLNMDEYVTISEKAWRMGGSRMYLKLNSRVTVHDVMKGLIIQSGNDASIALAEHIAGSEEAFVQLMNHYAVELEMNNTNFENSTGWPDSDHLTTARDIAALAIAIIREFPEDYSWYAEKVFTYNNIKQYNRNKLLWRDKSIDGIKTGHTESAGYGLVASAKRGNMRLISVVLGTKSEESRAKVSQSLLNYGFRFYETHVLYTAGDQLNNSRVWKGELETVSLGLAKDLHVTIPRGSYKYLKPVLDVNTNIIAPIAKGKQLGLVRVSLEEKELVREPLVALEEINKGNIFQIAKDHILQLFTK